MTIWALKGPSSTDYNPEELQKIQEFLTKSIKNGTSRFGWSYVDTADLTKLQNKIWQEMTTDEQNCWSKANFLLGVREGDWPVHINIPYWGACIACEVIEAYNFENEGNDFGDYRHTFKINTTTIVEFDRNDNRVLPIINSRLKLQGRYWTIQYVDEFLKTIDNLKTDSLDKRDDESVGIFYLKRDLSSPLLEITKKIHETHPGASLEKLIAEVFRRIPNVLDVKEHGQTKGWKTDSGADLIIRYKSGLSISNLEKNEILVVQVKSYTGQHWETKAVEQIENAIISFDADIGLIVSTAERTKILEEAIEALSNRLKKPIGLIAGEEVAKFVLKYGGEFIL